MKRVNAKEKPADEQTYRVLYEPPEGGYYKAQVKPGRDGEPDVEVLFVYKVRARGCGRGGGWGFKVAALAL